ncbi:phosphopantetheine-binding protein [Stenotrophomonas mori]|uniref:Acyl carrier protein n=1 Tax=Stenotrophomonas mori TaxID=2871096 RepID=A0ABT0SG71_9GAMM|nr:phosphopantetheine-binding protein [Stenotrophomonas mori]MCL7714005.1 acyl carrier protein [Stenotrophomonas mori]
MNAVPDVDAIRATINDLIVKQMQGNIDAAALTPQATLQDVGVASLDAVELIFDIEEHFDITFPDSRADGLGSDTLQDLVDAVQQGLREKAQATGG